MSSASGTGCLVKGSNARSEVLTEVFLKIHVFWDMTPSRGARNNFKTYEALPLILSYKGTEDKVVSAHAMKAYSFLTSALH